MHNTVSCDRTTISTWHLENRKKVSAGTQMCWRVLKEEHEELYNPCRSRSQLHWDRKGVSIMSYYEVSTSHAVGPALQSVSNQPLITAMERLPPAFLPGLQRHRLWFGLRGAGLWLGWAVRRGAHHDCWPPAGLPACGLRAHLHHGHHW